MINNFAQIWMENKLKQLGIPDLREDSSNVAYFCEHMKDSWLPESLRYRYSYPKGPELICPFHTFDQADVNAFQNDLLAKIKERENTIVQAVNAAIGALGAQAEELWLLDQHCGWLRLARKLREGPEYDQIKYLERERIVTKICDIPYYPNKYRNLLLSLPEIGKYVLVDIK